MFMAYLIGLVAFTVAGGVFLYLMRGQGSRFDQVALFVSTATAVIAWPAIIAIDMVILATALLCTALGLVPLVVNRTWRVFQSRRKSP